MVQIRYYEGTQLQLSRYFKWGAQQPFPQPNAADGVPLVLHDSSQVCPDR